MEQENIILEGQIVAVTKRSILLRIGTVDRYVQHDQPEEWIPKSQIEDCDADIDKFQPDDQIRLEIPYWFAKERELIDP